MYIFVLCLITILVPQIQSAAKCLARKNARCIRSLKSASATLRVIMLAKSRLSA